MPTNKHKRRRVIICDRCQKEFPIGTLTHIKMNKGKNLHLCEPCTYKEIPELKEVLH